MKVKTSLLTIDFTKVPIELISWTQMLSILETSTELTTVQIAKNLNRHVTYLKKSLEYKYSDDTLTEIEMWEMVIAHLTAFVRDTPITSIMANSVLEQANECPN